MKVLCLSLIFMLSTFLIRIFQLNLSFRFFLVLYISFFFFNIFLLSCSVINTTTTSFLDYISFYFMFIIFLFLVASYQNHLHVWHMYVEIVLPVDYSQLRLLNDHFLSHQPVLLNFPKILKIFFQMR